MHIPLRGRLFMPLSIIITIGLLIWVSLDWSWWSGVVGFLWIVSIALIWGIVITNRRVQAGRPMQLVADAEGIRTAMWSISWDRVDRV